MSKKLFALILCLLIFPTPALASDFDASVYSPEELQIILAKIHAQLYLYAAAEAEPDPLYANEHFSLHFSSLDEEGDAEYVYLQVLISNKTDQVLYFDFCKFSMDLSIFVSDTSGHLVYTPYIPIDYVASAEPLSSTSIAIPISRIEFEKCPKDTVEGVDLAFDYGYNADLSGAEYIGTNDHIRDAFSFMR